MNENSQDNLVVRKVKDKINLAIKKNQIQITDFLNMHEIEITSNLIKQEKIENYIWFGGWKEAERKSLVIYPDNWNKQVVEKNLDTYFSVIRIEFKQQENYTHRTYLGAIMKLGVKREKIGDILVNSDGADIIVQKEISDYLSENLRTLTRFKEANIKKVLLKDVQSVIVNKKERQIIVASNRLDTIISELAKCSRNKANEIINAERIFVNFKLETKKTKQIQIGDYITIRGKGRFVIKGIVGTTKNKRNIIQIEEYI